MGVTDTARNRSDQDHTFDDLRLTEWTSCGGCAAKWGAALLKDLVADFPVSNDPSLLIGLAPFDDAAVYRVSDDIAIVSTTDFFPPLVDHPSDFGAIAAANACSDVFAMGGRVVMAINVAAFPEHFPREAIAAIFEAAAAVVVEAGGSVAGGHTIRNPEPIFGLAVQGVVHPDRVFRKGGARAGDVLVLSKPIGTGLALAARHAADKAIAIAGMRQLNRTASETLQSFGDAVHAVTDVTGYGLAGHGWEVAERSDVRVIVDTSGIVAYPAAAAAAADGVRTGGDPRNRDYLSGHLDSTGAPPARRRCASTRRRRAGCWPLSIPTLRPDSSPKAGGGSARSRAALRGWCCGSVAGDDGPRAPTDAGARAGALGRGPRRRRRHRRGRPRRVGRAVDGRRRDPAQGLAGQRGAATRSCSPKPSARSSSTGSPAGAWPGPSGPPASRSATSSGWRRPSVWRPAAPSPRSASCPTRP